jgi:hypothetical protein
MPTPTHTSSLDDLTLITRGFGAWFRPENLEVVSADTPMMWRAIWIHETGMEGPEEV